MRKVCLLGASGSIGTQTIDVMRKNPQDFSLVSFSVGCQTRKISTIIRMFPTVKAVCIRYKHKVKYYSNKYPEIKFFYGDSGLKDLITYVDCDMVVNALVGFSGLLPTITALENNKILCLANKESLVVGGELVNKLLKEGYGKLYPIDSEHVALAKCLAVDNKNVDKLIITASGGAFRKLNRDQLENVTPEDALCHPTWKMGKKITIDCASMVNKTFEVIEAHYLYGYKTDDIDILINYESYVHSLVKYKDGSYRLDVGKPDMRIPIKYALYEGLTPFKTTYTDDLNSLKDITFHKFDEQRYPIIRYARKVIEEKGTYGAVLNAANEVAVHAFLEHKISFLDIENIISTLMDNHKNIKHPTLDEILKADFITRLEASMMVEERRKN